MSAQRLHRMRTALARRQPDLTVATAGVHKEHNISAVVRTCDAVGVPEVHSMGQEGQVAIRRTASAGITRWVTVRHHETVTGGLLALREAGFQLLAAHASADAVPFRDVDYTRPSAVILGRELEGMPEPAVSMADSHVSIPMAGLTESLNVSVAAAVILFEAQRQRAAAGYYDTCRLDPETFRCTLFEWMQPTIARYCQRHGLPYPELDDEGHVVGGLGKAAGKR